MIVSGVGSLPHVSVADAAEFVAATADLPYLPQLPRRHPEEGMLRQWGDGLCGCGAADDGIGLAHGAPIGPRHEAFAAAEAVLAGFTGPALKTQITGPVTMAVALRAAGHPGGTELWDCVVSGLADRLSDHVEMVRRSAADAELHVVVDEPGLVALAPPARHGFHADARAALGAFFAASPVPLGIHCCGGTDWSLVASLAPAVISWDLATLGGGFAGADEALAAAIAAGTRLAWGVVSTEPGAGHDPAVARARYGTAVARLVIAGAPVEGLVADAWATPACGLAGLTEEAAVVVAQRVRDFAGDSGV